MNEVSLKKLGFYFGTSGGHAGRSLMLTDLDSLIHQAPADANSAWFTNAILEDNLLGKSSVNNREHASRRMRQMYGLDASMCLYRNFRSLYLADKTSQPMLCVLMVMARDALFRKSAEVILRSELNQAVSSRDFRDSLDAIAAGRMGDETLKHACNNVFNSWTQAGFLTDAVARTRTKPQLGWAAVAFALFLGWLEGDSGRLLFETRWAQVLDHPITELISLATAASRHGQLEFLNAGGVIEVRFPEYLTEEERQLP